MATPIASTKTTSSTLTAITNGVPRFEFRVTRMDDGKASVVLYKDGKVVVVHLNNAGWDDAIPWPAGTYQVELAGERFKLNGVDQPKFDFVGATPDAEHRTGIQMHLGNMSNPK